MVHYKNIFKVPWFAHAGMRENKYMYDILDICNKAITIYLFVWRQLFFSKWGGYEANKQNPNNKTRRISQNLFLYQYAIV